MGMFKRSGGKAVNTVVGLDIDPGHLAAAEVHVNGSLSVTRGAVAALRPGILRDGELADGPALTEALKALWAEHKLPDRVRVGIANQRIVVRTLDLPPLTDEKAIASAVKVEAPDHIPMPIDEAVLDYQSLGIVGTPAGPRTRVVVVAVRREMVERYAEAIRAAGLKIEGVDLSAFALVRAMAHQNGDGGLESGVLYVHAAGLTNVAVASGGNCLFTRAAAGGLDTLIHTLAERRGLTLEHAEQWVKHVGLEKPLEEVEGETEVVHATRAVLEEGVHQLSDTVRNSLNFYRMQDNSETVSRAILTGPATDVPGFAEAFAQALGMPVDAGVVAHGDETADPSRLAIAAGLAVESV
jgi:type IV pilus assembly protein PilM